MPNNRLLDGRLKIRHLTLAVAIAQEGSLVRTAETLHVTQPVVTRALRELESILGVELFERLPRGMAPTEYGRAFIDRAQGLLAQLRAADDEIELMRSGAIGSVTVGTHLAGSNVLLPRAIRALKTELPELTVIVREGTPDLLEQMLVSGDIDLTVGRLTPTSARFAQENLYREPVRLVARAEHPLQARRAITLSDLLPYPWVLPLPQTRLRTELEAVFFEAGLPLPANRVECTSMLTLRHLLVFTDSVAALPTLITSDDTRLTLLPMPLIVSNRSVGATMLADRLPSAATTALLGFLRSAGRRLEQVTPS